MTDFEIIRPERKGRVPLLFVCDHASNQLPQAYGTLGLARNVLGTHIAHDIGAGTVTRNLASRFGAPAVLAKWSRLLIDLNRGSDDPTLVMKLSDGSIIKGNAAADATEIASRISRFYEPYHAAIEGELQSFFLEGQVPSLVSIHSFTPIWKSERRSWDVCVLWDRDGRLARPLMESLRGAGFVVGDNQPYSGELENDCMYRHGTLNGLPHVLIEIRQDLIDTESAATAMATRLEPCLAAALKVMGKTHISLSRPLAAKGTLMDDSTRTELEAAVFRRLVAHLRERTDVQNIDLMIVGGFCRNCLGDWYREEASGKGIVLGKDEARALVYGMAPSDWKKRFQKDVTPEQQAAFERSQQMHK